MDATLWRLEDFYDDPTSGVREGEVIRETVAGASLVVVDGPMSLAEIFRLEAEVRAQGSRLVLQGRARTGCPVSGSEEAN